VYGFAPISVRDRISVERWADNQLESFLEGLDEEFGDPDGPTRPTEPMKLAALDGRVSALCYSKPRRIPARETWTLREEAVTCKSCLDAIGKTRSALAQAAAEVQRG
jgi:hypothetical protein